MKYIAVEADRVPQEDGGVLRVQKGTHDIALFRVGDELRAIDNACPHQGASLSDGWVDDGVVACPWHAWLFNTADGTCLTLPGCDVNTYAIEMQGDDVLIRVKHLPTTEDGSDEGMEQMDA